MPRKQCVEQGCEKYAREPTDRCKRHGGGPRCIEVDCKKAAVDNSRCKLHGGGPRCVESGCGRAARGKTDKCTAHGGGKRCIESGCGRSARDKYDKCKRHGGGPRCIEEGCETSAVEPTDRCKIHGGGKRCTELGCNSPARGKTDKCVAHGGGRRCSEQGCENGARDKCDKCRAHGGGLRCPNCITWIDSRSGSVRYDGYCATCFKRIFPNDARSKVVHTHTKEIRVRNKINENFDGFIHDKPLYTGQCDCTHRRRIDHRKLIGSTLLCVETDEFGHANYDQKDEEIRYDDLFMVYSGKWVFIRFNPDGKGVDMDDKLDCLIEEMQKQIDRIEAGENTKLLEVVKLFY